LKRKGSPYSDDPVEVKLVNVLVGKGLKIGDRKDNLQNAPDYEGHERGMPYVELDPIASADKTVVFYVQSDHAFGIDHIRVKKTTAPEDE